MPSNPFKNQFGTLRLASRLLALIAVVWVALPAWADERILSFSSFIEVQPNAELTVTETIKVRAENNRINHGVYRDFPTLYHDQEGHRYEVDMTVKSVSLDDQREDYHLEDLSNGKRIYMGSRNRIVTPGEHTYRLTYKVNRELGFFKDHDELYWNVNGLGWVFPIDDLSAIVKLPSGASNYLTLQKAFTGPAGSKDNDYDTTITEDGLILFRGTRAFGPSEGMTILVGWPKGFVQEPDAFMKAWWHFRDNLHVMIGLFGLALLLTFYTVIWYQYGRDPAKGTVIPLFTPPGNMSPAMMRIILTMSSDNKAFTAAILNLAVKGVINVRRDDGVFMGIGKNWHLERVSDEVSNLSQEERIVLDTLLPLSGSTLTMVNTNADTIRSAISQFDYALKKRAEDRYFVINTGWLFCGIVIALVTGIPMMTMRELHAGNGISLAPWGIAIAMIVTILGFRILLKAPTVAGRKVMDQILGFKQFLSVSEKNLLNFATPPNITPEIFERYLPYALALDVENQWAQKFETAMLAAGQVMDNGYHPVWYSGNGDFSPASFTSDLGSSFSDSISSAATPPGDSSGGGGSSCGSSGGGGGGGGGGGW